MCLLNREVEHLLDMLLRGNGLDCANTPACLANMRAYPELTGFHPALCVGVEGMGRRGLNLLIIDLKMHYYGVIMDQDVGHRVVAFGLYVLVVSQHMLAHLDRADRLFAVVGGHRRVGAE